jgi:hypothetical protein
MRQAARSSLSGRHAAKVILQQEDMVDGAGDEPPIRGVLSLVVAFFLLSLHQGSAARDTHAPFFARRTFAFFDLAFHERAWKRSCGRPALS